MAALTTVAGVCDRVRERERVWLCVSCMFCGVVKDGSVDRMCRPDNLGAPELTCVPINTAVPQPAPALPSRKRLVTVPSHTGEGRCPADGPETGRRRDY